MYKYVQISTVVSVKGDSSADARQAPLGGAGVPKVHDGRRQIFEDFGTNTNIGVKQI